MIVRSGWLTFVVGGMMVAVSAAFGANPPDSSKAPGKAAKPRVLVTISKETTYITEPLRSDGYPDYVAALNQRLSEGVTPDNNAAVLIWKAMGPKNIPLNVREPFFKMLGIEPLPEKGDYFVTWSSFHDQHLDKQTVTQDERRSASAGAYEQLSRIMARPWSKQEYPLWADWVEQNEKPLAMIVEATKRPKLYEPYLSDMVMTALLPGAQQSRDVARGLLAAAMYRLAEGKTDEAWEDLLACHRLARLVGQGSTLVEDLIAITIETLAEKADQGMLEHGKLSSAQIAKMRADLAALPPMPKMADKLNLNERFMFLDAVCVLSRKGPGELSGLLSDGTPQKGKHPLEKFLEGLAMEAIDWDLILKQGNSWHDRIQDACHRPTRAERQKAWQDIETDCKALAKKVKDWNSLGAAMFDGPTKAISQRLGDVLVSLLLPALQAAMLAEDRSAMQSELDDLAFALAQYKADNGSYPARLAELAPKYVHEIPKDRFASDADLQYRLEDGGFLLYSVGQNGKDDGGKSFDDRKPDGTSYDDLVVRVPSAAKR